MALERTIKIKVDSRAAKKNVDKLDDSVDKLDRTAKETNASFGKLKGAVIAVAAALQIRQVAQYADAFTSVQNQIRQTTNSTEQLAKRTSALLDVANRSRVSFEATADLYTQLTLSTENLNLSTEEQLRLTETISKSFAVSGKSAAESAGAIRQLGQAFAAGALRGDEFNSIAEGAPEIMRALQRSLKLTQGELREFAATGGITSEILVTALSGAAEVIDDKLAKSTRTLAQSFQEAENNAIAFVGASDLVTTSIGSVGDSIVFLSNNLDKIANVLLVAAILGVSRLSSALIINTIETVKNTVAKGSSIVTTSAIVSATGKQIVTTTHLTAAQRAATIASTGLTKAMAFLGGPLGVVLLAVSAIALFASTSDDAIDPVSGLTKEVNKMVDGFANLNKGQIEAQLANSIASVDQLKSKIEAINSSPLQGSKLLGGSDIQLAKLKKDLEEAIKLRDALFQAGLSAGRTPTDQSDAPENRGAGAAGGGGDSEAERTVNVEAFKTANLREELNARLEIQKLHNSLMLQEFSSLADQERAIAEFNQQADLIDLEASRNQQLNDFALRREQLLINTQLDADAKLELITQIESQELIAKANFEADKTDIEREAAQDRADIARQEASSKLNALQGYGQTALQLNELFGSKSEKANKKRRKTAVQIDAAAGIIRAYAENNFWVASGMAVAIAATAASQLSAIDSAGGGGGSVSFGSGGTAGTSEQPERQEPIQRINIVENRGLSEIAALLANMDPGEVLPVEYVQRIMISIDENDRLNGGGG